MFHAQGRGHLGGTFSAPKIPINGFKGLTEV